jgi:rod shape-determining protein MreC
VGELEPAAKLDRGRNVLLLRSVPSVPQLPVTTGLEPPALTPDTAVPAAGAGLAPSHRPTPDSTQPSAAQSNTPSPVPTTTQPAATTPPASTTAAPTTAAPAPSATAPTQATPAASPEVRP